MKIPQVIERFSVGWINSIPRTLARGIWDAIEDGIAGKEHSRATENERRRKQIAAGTLVPSSMGKLRIAEGADARANARIAARVAERERIAAERSERRDRIREAVIAATSAENRGEDSSGGAVCLPDADDDDCGDRRVDPDDDAGAGETPDDGRGVCEEREINTAEPAEGVIEQQLAPDERHEGTES